MDRLKRKGLALGASAALTLTCGAWSAAQTPQSTPQSSPQSTPTQSTPQSAPSSQTPGAQAAPSQSTPTTGATQPAQQTIHMVEAKAELGKTIDSKKAKQGDAVTARLVADVNVPDAQPLPKNTVLEGHVDQVTPSDHKSDATMVVTFDKAKLKSGQEVPIKATVLAMAEPALMTSDASGGGGGAAGGGMPAGGMEPSSGGGGGSTGGGGARGAGGSSGSSGSSVPTQQPPGMADAGGGSGDSGQQQPAGNSNVPGVKLTSDIHQHNSATFSSKGKNVHVPDGTLMAMAIGIVPAGAQVQ